ncbi:MAG: transcription termination factor NusA [Patescibacteria group bacterium]
MSSEITKAIQQICDEKGISAESVMASIEAALAVAYRKEFGNKEQNIQVTFDPETGGMEIVDVKEVVSDELKTVYDAEMVELQKKIEEAEARGEDIPKPERPFSGSDGEGTERELRFDAKKNISVTDAQTLKPGAVLGDVIQTKLEAPQEFGRMAAQTAKQVIIQKLREAERETIFAAFKGKEGEILNGTIQRVEGRTVFIDIGRAVGVMPYPEQIEREHYTPGQRLKFCLVSVESTSKGPELRLSRAHPNMVRKLFELEVPEIAGGLIEIKSLAREAGSRTKIAVYTTEPNIDPVGSCVGQRGTRVQTVISELGGEKIDIIQYDADLVKFIIHALSPAKVLSVRLDEATQAAVAEVNEDQLSLAIGKGGQNVRLAAKLTGWRIDVVKASDGEEPAKPAEASQQPEEAPSPDGAASSGESVAEVVSDESRDVSPPEEKAEELPVSEDSASPSSEEK